MTKEELKEYKSLLREIRYIGSELREYERTAIVTGSSQEYPYIKRRFSVNASEDRYNLLIEREKRCKEKKEEIEKYIDSIKSSQVRLIISMRYIKGFSWTKISIELGGGNTADGVRKIHDRFLAKK